jgi:hypothetical protein
VSVPFLKYLKYRLTARTAHGIHSPFVYKFIHELIESDREGYYSFEELNKIREQLLRDETLITITDFGAGSRIFKNNQRRISDIARHGISKSKFSELYFKLINFSNAEYVLELGTSLGLNTLYLSKANPNAKIHTVEGCEELSNFARRLFEKHNADNIILYNDKFETALPRVLDQIPRLDFLYVDGNHRYGPTMEYFTMGLGKKHNDSVFVFDDINWNEDMSRAWEEIKSRPEVTLSIDLFYAGIVFFRKEQKEKEHFVLRF